MLDPTRRDLGQVALGVTETFNQQNRQGLDLNGNLGTDLFAGFTPEVLPSFNNAGATTVTAAFADLTAVESRDYKLRYDGAAWNFSDATSGAVIAATGSGSVADPFVIDGMEVVIGGGAPAAGDEFRLRPVSAAASAVNVVMSDINQIAAAKPITTGSSVFNVGNASVSAATVDDISDPNLLQSVNVVFDDPPSTYRITDAGGTPLTASLPYTSGGDISLNGWTVQIDGTPQAGDSFTLDSTGAGSGDNANANALGQQFSQGFFNNGQFSVQELSAQLTTSVGSYVARSSSELNVQSSITQQLQLDLESVAGVNLDEEAANMLRYQQAYMAASKMISVSNDLFQTIINAVR